MASSEFKAFTNAVSFALWRVLILAVGANAYVAVVIDDVSIRKAGSPIRMLLIHLPTDAGKIRARNHADALGVAGVHHLQ